MQLSVVGEWAHDEEWVSRGPVAVNGDAPREAIRKCEPHPYEDSPIGKPPLHDIGDLRVILWPDLDFGDAADRRETVVVDEDEADELDTGVNGQLLPFAGRCDAIDGQLCPILVVG